MHHIQSASQNIGMLGCWFARCFRELGCVQHSVILMNEVVKMPEDRLIQKYTYTTMISTTHSRMFGNLEVQKTPLFPAEFDMMKGSDIKCPARE